MSNIVAFPMPWFLDLSGFFAKMALPDRAGIFPASVLLVFSKKFDRALFGLCYSDQVGVIFDVAPSVG